MEEVANIGDVLSYWMVLN